MEKTGVRCVSAQVPVNFMEIAKRVGNMSQQNLWCRMDGKFIAIEYAQSVIGMKNAIAFEGTRRAESKTRVNRHWFEPAANEEGIDKFRPVLDFSNRKICDYCMQNGYPLIGCYEYADRSGCTCCPSKTAYGWAATRMFYPNLFRAYLKFLEACSCDPHWVKYYAKIELEKLFRFKLNKETFKRPHTAGYTSKTAYEKLLGIKMDDIRDNPDISFEEIYEMCDVKPNIEFVKAPSTKHLDAVMAKPAGEPLLKLQHLFP
jgi:3'-phosphoadenosine 5'-phosphosulfate sulfotransferase (PAPS reductase)/FAD synthetase